MRSAEILRLSLAAALVGLPLPRDPAAWSGERALQEARARQLGWGRDPFAKGGGPMAGGMVLSGIVWDTQHPMAILNGEPLGVGDRAGNLQVLEIHEDRVLVTDGTSTSTLQLNP